MSFEESAAIDAVEIDVEDQEVVEPDETEPEDTGVEEPEVTDPESEEPEKPGKSAQDAAFAKMRRRAEEAERKWAEKEAEIEKMKAEKAAREAALANMDIDDIDAIAEHAGISRDEVLANFEREQMAAEAEIESKEKDQTIAAMQKRLDEVEAEKLMAQDLAALQKIDPKIESLDDLGDDFVAYIGAGLTAEQAYYAIRGRELTTKSTPAKAPGKITEDAPPAKKFYTEEEVDNMTPAEQRRLHKEIIASMPNW